METLKLAEPEIIEEAEGLLKRLEGSILMTPKHIDLNNIPEEQLLATRIRDLPISIEGTWLEECVKAIIRRTGCQGAGVPSGVLSGG